MAQAPARVCYLLLIAGMLKPHLSAAEPWNRFRGPAGSGVLDVQELPESLNPAVNQLWTVAVPRGKSSPVIAGHRLCLTGWRGSSLLVLCYDRLTGRLLWERSIPKAHKQTMNGLNDGAAPTVAADSTGVYAFFSEAGLFAFDAADGKPRWKVPLGPFNSVHGVGTSPVAADGFVLLAMEQQVGGSWLAAFDASTGARKWQTNFEATGQQGYSTAALFTPPSQLTQVILSRPGEVGAWSLLTGKPVWWIRGTGGQAFSSPAISGNGTVFAAADGSSLEDAMAAWEGFVKKFNRTKERTLRVKEDWNGDTIERADKTFGNGDGLLDEGEWRKFAASDKPRSLIAVQAGGSGDVSGGRLVWRSARSVPGVASPIWYRDVLYLIRDGGILTSLDPKTGNVLRESRLPGVSEKFYSSPVAGDGKLYLISEQGKAVVVRAGSSSWEMLSVTDLGEDVFATPAIATDGRVYVRTAETLRCFRSSQLSGTR
jgi:outer membrane protein assembly factor BamB